MSTAPAPTPEALVSIAKDCWKFGRASTRVRLITCLKDSKATWASLFHLKASFLSSLVSGDVFVYNFSWSVDNIPSDPRIPSSLWDWLGGGGGGSSTWRQFSSLLLALHLQTTIDLKFLLSFQIDIFSDWYVIYGLPALERLGEDEWHDPHRICCKPKYHQRRLAWIASKRDGRCRSSGIERLWGQLSTQKAWHGINSGLHASRMPFSRCPPFSCGSGDILIWDRVLKNFCSFYFV